MFSETQHIELKSGFNEDVIETLTAFANTKGGRVLVGVADSGLPVKGFTVGKESIQRWLNEIKTKTQPAIIPDVDVVEYNGAEVVEFSVQEFPIKPVAFRGRYFKRVKNSNHQLSISEISDAYLQSMQYSWDAYPYPRASIGSLQLGKVKTFISKVNATGRFQLPGNPVEALEKLRMLKDGVPTNAAMILFSRENLLYNIHIGRFKTPSLIIADKMINGNLYDVVTESVQTIIGHLKFAFEITGKTTQRTEIPEYPLDAIREALLNALIHRNYQSPTDVQIKIFDQKITFFNPGGLFGDITEDDLRTNAYRASTRNKQLAEAFYLTHDIEKYGSGFIRIRKAIATYPTMKFDFRNLGDGFLSEFSYTEQKISTKIKGPEKPEKGPEKGPEKPEKGPEKPEKPEKGHEKGPEKPEKGPEKGPEKPEKGPEKGPEKPEKGPEKGPGKGPEKPEKGPEKITANQQKIIEAIRNNPSVTREELATIARISLSKIGENISKLKAKGLIERIGPDKGGYWKVLE